MLSYALESLRTAGPRAPDGVSLPRQCAPMWNPAFKLPAHAKVRSSALLQGWQQLTDVEANSPQGQPIPALMMHMRLGICTDTLTTKELLNNQKQQVLQQPQSLSTTKADKQKYHK